MSHSQDSHQPATVLVVDDTPDNLLLMADLLRDKYRVKVANSGEKALRILQGDTLPDLILLDIMMPGLSGHQVAEQIQQDPRIRHIPIIFLTAMAAMESEIQGLALGAVDYITKPISPPRVLARVDTQLKIKAAADFLRDSNDYLEQEVQRRTREVMAIQDVTILVMASMAETRDNETGNHIRRTQHYVKLLAELLRDHPRFSHFLNDATINLLFKSAPLHDIGKVGIPDSILLKPGRLTVEEFEIMMTHTTLGRDAIQHAEDQLGFSVDFLRLAKEIAYSHQEKWDGSGYPQGLAGDDIPISARLMAVADVYDALISRRVYKPSMPHEEAVDIIRQGGGLALRPGCLRRLPVCRRAIQGHRRAIQRHRSGHGQAADHHTSPPPLSERQGTSDECALPPARAATQAVTGIYRAADVGARVPESVHPGSAGRGYHPQGACLMVVAEVFDGLISHRVYKPGMPHEEAMDIIRQGGGRHFDSDVCAAFLSTTAQCRATKARES